MSAFIVSEAVMHNVVRLIMKGGTTVNFGGYSTVHGPAWRADAIGRALYGLNMDAVKVRYPLLLGRPDDPTKATRHLPTKYRYCDNWTEMDRTQRIPAYKAAVCLLHQCSEDGITDRQLYRELETLVRAAAERIVSELPEYDAAPWG